MLNNEMFEMVKNACISALNEIGEIEALNDALNGRVCDLEDLIDLHEILG